MIDKELTRAGFIAGAAAAGAAATGVSASAAATGASVAATVPDTARIVAQSGKKVRVGVPLTYGPLNQPWRRGCGMLIKRLLELGAEPVTFRGEPTKDSERNAEEQLLTRNVDVLVMGIYQTESESRATAQKAQAQGVKTVGFATYVYNSPNVVEDQFRTALTLGDFVIDKLQRQGTVVQTAENPGFYQPFDIEVSTLDLMVHWQSRMKMLPFMPGGVSTQNERQLARENVSRLLAANPAKGSVNAVVSWWWPDTLGAQDALHQAGRTEVLLANHYFSNELLTAMSRPDTLIAASTDTPWHIIGTTTADLAVALAHGQSLPPATHFVPVTFIEKKDAAKALAEVQSMDTEVIALLSKYGG